MDVIHPGIPGATNRWFSNQGQARVAALQVATHLGPGHTIAHDPRPSRGLPHYHVVDPNGRRVSGHFFYGRRPPRKVLRGRPWREVESAGEAELESMLQRIDRALAATEAEAMVYRTPPHPGAQTRLSYSNARQEMSTAIARQRAAQARLAQARERFTLAHAQHMQQLQMAMGDFSYLDPTITREFQGARADLDAAQAQAQQAIHALNAARQRYAATRRDRQQYRQTQRTARRPAREYEAMAGRTRRSRPDRVIQQLIRANTALAAAQTAIDRGATTTAIQQLRRAMQALIAARAIAGNARIWASEARMRLERPAPWMQGALDAISRAREATVRAINARRSALGRPVSG